MLRVHFAQALEALDVVLFALGLFQRLFERFVIEDVFAPAAYLELVEWRLGDVKVAAVDYRAHEAVEESQQQGANVRTVDVGVGHQDDLVVADALDVEMSLVAGALDAGADGGDHRPDLVVLERLLQVGLLDVQDLAAQRQNGLEAAVAPLFGRAAGRVALDDEELGFFGLFGLAVGQFAGQVVGLERVLPPHQLTRLAGRLARLGGALGLAVDRLGDARVGLEKVH